MAAVTLQLRDLADDGDAVGIYQGCAVFVSLGIPGETVRVELIPGSKHQSRGNLLEVIRPAAERVQPLCPYFGVCGGCHWQHIGYEAQLRFKQERLISRLQRIGRQPEPFVRPVHGLEDPWSYRNHVQFALSGAGRLGFQALRSHHVVPIVECAITHPLLDDLWDSLDIEFEGLQRVSLRAGIATGEQMIILEGKGPEVPELEVEIPASCLYQSADGDLLVMAGSSYFHERLQERTLRISGPSFFQVNTPQAEQLLQIVRAYLDPQPRERLLDAYCGVGTFALALSSCVAQVVGIEGAPWSIEDALANRRAEENVEFVQGDVEEILPALGSFDAAILDPPRAGCSLAALQALALARPERVAYVSCDPATLARDIARLNTLGYTLVEVQPVDMFPQTFHLESVALLTRQKHEL
jgi:23S rRNA (uracil1939-C5)-methyltransferase